MNGTNVSGEAPRAIPSNELNVSEPDHDRYAASPRQPADSSSVDTSSCSPACVRSRCSGARDAAELRQSSCSACPTLLNCSAASSRRDFFGTGRRGSTASAASAAARLSA